LKVYSIVVVVYYCRGARYVFTSADWRSLERSSSFERCCQGISSFLIMFSSDLKSRTTTRHLFITLATLGQFSVFSRPY